MKVFLMHADRDFDFAAQLPANETECSQDLELDTLLSAMAGDEQLLYDVGKRALLSPLTEPAEIRFRQAVLADCLTHPSVVRRLHDLALEAIGGERQYWRAFQDSPQAILSRAVQVLGFYVGVLRALRAIADEHHTEFHSAGFRRFFTMLQNELDDAYFAQVENHLATLQFKNGTLLSARLGAGNRGTDYVLREQRERPWIERVSGGLRHSRHSFQIDERDVAGAEAYAELANRGINPVANALAQSSEHIKSFFTMLLAELAFYLGALNLSDCLADRGARTCVPDPLPAGAAKLTARGVYDVSLALTLDSGVTANDLDADGRRW